MKIEILFFDGCPSWLTAYQYLQEILEENGMEIKIDQIRIDSDEKAKIHQFPVSPTIRLNGMDLFPIEQADYRLGCRIFQTEEGYAGSPTQEMIEQNLIRLIGTKRNP